MDMTCLASRHAAAFLFLRPPACIGCAHTRTYPPTGQFRRSAADYIPGHISGWRPGALRTWFGDSSHTRQKEAPNERSATIKRFPKSGYSSGFERIIGLAHRGNLS